MKLNKLFGCEVHLKNKEIVLIDKHGTVRRINRNCPQYKVVLDEFLNTGENNKEGE